MDAEVYDYINLIIDNLSDDLLKKKYRDIR